MNGEDLAAAKSLAVHLTQPINSMPPVDVNALISQANRSFHFSIPFIPLSCRAGYALLKEKGATLESGGRLALLTIGWERAEEASSYAAAITKLAEISELGNRNILYRDGNCVTLYLRNTSVQKDDPFLAAPTGLTQSIGKLLW